MPADLPAASRSFPLSGPVPLLSHNDVQGVLAKTLGSTDLGFNT